MFMAQISLLKERVGNGLLDSMRRSFAPSETKFASSEDNDGCLVRNGRSHPLGAGGDGENRTERCQANKVDVAAPPSRAPE